MIDWIYRITPQRMNKKIILYHYVKRSSVKLYNYHVMFINLLTKTFSATEF